VPDKPLVVPLYLRVAVAAVVMYKAAAAAVVH
jgi:hypothetical protein